ncbi:hypothetical protein D3C77_763860 [compost metagenome]
MGVAEKQQPQAFAECADAQGKYLVIQRWMPLVQRLRAGIAGAQTLQQLSFAQPGGGGIEGL